MPARWTRLVLPVGFALGLAAGMLAGAIVGPRLASAALEGPIKPSAASVSGALPACTTKPFPDVELGHPYCAEIGWLSANLITTGYADGTYRPDDNTKRQTWAPFLARFLDASTSACAVKPFNDVATSHPFCPQIKWMKAEGITTGYVDGTFRPADDAKRHAIAVFLARGADATLTPCNTQPFTDVPTNHPFCREIKWLGETGIFTGYGDGSFHPTESVTRGEAAALLYRVALLLDAAPVVTTSGGDTPYIEGDPATAIDGTLTVTDADDTNLESAQVRISSGFQSDDALTFVDTAAITGTYDSGTGVLTLSGTDSVADYEAALRSITFASTGNNPVASKTVEFKVNDGTADSNAATKGLAIAAVNDAPLVTTSAGATAYTEGGIPVAIDGGGSVTVTDADDTNLESATVSITTNFETGDTLGFVDTPSITGSYDTGTGVLTLTGPDSVANYQAALQAVTYDSASNQAPNALKTVTFVANDGDTDSPPATKDLAITAVNDAPTNTVPASAVVDEDTALNLTGGNTVSVADPDAGAGALEIDLSVTNGTLTMTTLSDLAFTDGNGSNDATMTFTGTLANINAALATLSFTPTLNFPGSAASGIAAFSITSDDQGNTGTGGALTDTDGFNITVSQVNDAPDAVDHTLTTSSSIQITIGSGDTGKLKDGATDVDDPDGDLTVSTTFTDVDPGADVSLTDAATGTYMYNPAAGFTGTDTFSYQVCDDGALCDTASVAVTVNGVDLWFVDDSAALGGTGRLTDPFDALSDLPGGRGTGDRIFVFSGTYGTGHTLLTGERLIGQGASGSTFDTLLGVQVPVNGTLDARPSVGGSAATLQDTLNLATNAQVLGIAVSSTTNTALSGSGGLTGVDVGQTTLNTTTGTALSLNNVDGTLNLPDVSKNGTGTAISLTNVTADVTIPAGTIQNTTTGAIFLDGGAGDFSYGGTLSSITSGRAVTVQNKTAGSLVTFSGAIGTTGTPLGGQGIRLDNNDQAGGSGGSITFSGGVNLSTGPFSAFTAFNGGVVNVTGTNTLTTTTAFALQVNSTTIGASGLTFRSINVDGNDSVPANGIQLIGTGSSGGLTVTGTGSAGTGGTIRDTLNDGIQLIGTLSPSLSWMTITSNLGNGIRGGDGTAGGVVTNATLSNLTVSNNGDNSGSEDGILFLGLVGTATWSNLDVFGSSRHNASVINNTGTLNSLTVSGSNIHDNSTVGSNGLTFIADGTAVMTVNVGTTNFTFNHSNGVLGQTTGSGTLTLTVTGGTFTNNFIGVEFSHASSGNLTGTFTGGTITNTNGCTLGFSECGAPVNIFLSNQASSSAASILRATVTNNTINNGGSENAPGVWVHTGTPVTGHIRALITANNISNVENRGIDVSGGGCVSPATCNATIDVTIENNIVATSGPLALEGIALTGATGTADTIDFCVDIENNTASSTGHDGIRVRHRQSTRVRLPGYGGGIYDTAAVDAYLTGRNPATNAIPETITATTSSAGLGFVNGICATP